MCENTHARTRAHTPRTHIAYLVLFVRGVRILFSRNVDNEERRSSVPMISAFVLAALGAIAPASVSLREIIAPAQGATLAATVGGTGFEPENACNLMLVFCAVRKSSSSSSRYP